MHREPFGVFDPLKYALSTLVSQWHLGIGFTLLLFIGELVGGLAIIVADTLYTGGQFNVIAESYKQLALQYQKMTNFEVNHEIWFNPLIKSWPVTVCAGMILILFLIWIEVGLVETALRFHDTGKADVNTLVSRSYGTIVKMIPLAFLTFIVFIFFAFVLNFLPLIYFGKERGDLFHSIKALVELYIFFRISFVAFYMIDTKSSLLYAMKHAYHPVLWQGGQLFEAYFVVYLFDIGAGFIPLFGRAMGIWAICFAETYMYRKLIPAQESAPEKAFHEQPHETDNSRDRVSIEDRKIDKVSL